MALSQLTQGKPPSKLFLAYVARLVFRALLFAYVIYLFVRHPHRLQVSAYFGPAHGLNCVDVMFAAILVDMITKFFPSAKVSMGSLKQYRNVHVPTFDVFRGGKEGFTAFVEHSWTSGKELVIDAKNKGINVLKEVKDGTVDTTKSLLRDMPFLRSLKYQSEDLTASEQMRSQIRHDRALEIIPVVLFWIAFNSVVIIALGLTGNINEQTLVLWCSFYFMSDMLCVVLWCPLQLFLMKNRCCTTCHIFNWDAIMTVSPLIPLLAISPFSLILVLMALVILIRWEAAFARYPERFDERANQSLKCANCTDKLCFVRTPLTKLAEEIKPR